MSSKFGYSILFAIALIFICHVAGAQGMAVNTDGSSANASAMLDVSSTTKGMLVPRMTTLQKRTIPSPSTGLLVYQTDSTTGFYYYDGSVWALIGCASSSFSIPPYTTINSSQTLPALSGNYIVTGTYNITFPANPPVGTIIKIVSRFGMTFNSNGKSYVEVVNGTILPQNSYTFGSNYAGYSMTAIFDGTYWFIQATI